MHKKRSPKTWKRGWKSLKSQDETTQTKELLRSANIRRILETWKDLLSRRLHRKLRKNKQTKKKNNKKQKKKQKSQSQVESYQRFKKWYLIPPCLTLSIIRNVSRGKWSNPGKIEAPSLTLRCSIYWKGSFRVAKYLSLPPTRHDFG